MRGESGFGWKSGGENDFFVKFCVWNVDFDAARTSFVLAASSTTLRRVALASLLRSVGNKDRPAG